MQEQNPSSDVKVVMKVVTAMLLLFVFVPQSTLAQKIYAGKGTFGEASFSDEPLAGHQAVTIDVIPGDSPATAQQTAAELEALAEELAQARRSRDEARRTSAPNETVVVEPYYPEPVRTYYPIRYYPRQRAPAIEPAPPLPPRRTFEPAFRPIRPSVP